jgi:hypothetical protein
VIGGIRFYISGAPNSYAQQAPSAEDNATVYCLEGTMHLEYGYDSSD